jgi:multicomponent Na+:H+ antiporter subunit B
MRVPPVVVAGVGLLAALASALPGLVVGEPLLTHLWIGVDLGVVTLPLGTTLVFDVGVYLVVVGMATGVTLPFLEEA